jgi:DNA-binding transcriptional LysR family regulator
MPTAIEDRLLHRIRLRELRAFLAVCERGSMADASRQLGMSQPAVSKVIKELETTLSVQLFDRKVRGVEPNAYGRALLRWAPALFDDLRQAVKEVKAVDDPAVGEIRISSTEPMTAGFVPEVIEKLSRKHPRLSFAVSQATTIAGQYEDLRSRRVDLILGRTILAKADERDLISETLFDDRLFVVVGLNHRLAKRRTIDIADLVDEPWCVPAYQGSFAGELVARAFASRKLLPPPQAVTSTSIQLFAALLASGRFVSALSRSAVTFSGRRLGLKALQTNPLLESGPVGIVTLRGKAVTAPVQLFIQAARDVAKVIVASGGTSADQRRRR